MGAASQTSTKVSAKVLAKTPAITPAFVVHCQELMACGSASGSPPTARRMFGGWGLRLDGSFVALIAFDRLYLKVDDDTRPAFAQAGCEPFVYDGKGKVMTMSYWTVPDQALESADFMRPWARLALQAALAAQAKKPQKASKKTPTSSKASKARRLR
jgi:DNA transformation protein